MASDYSPALYPTTPNAISLYAPNNIMSLGSIEQVNQGYHLDAKDIKYWGSIGSEPLPVPNHTISLENPNSDEYNPSAHLAPYLYYPDNRYQYYDTNPTSNSDDSRLCYNNKRQTCCNIL